MWWYEDEGQKRGPKSGEEMRRLVLADHVTKQTLVWTSGMDGWRPAGAVHDLVDLFVAAPPPLPPRNRDTLSEPGAPARDVAPASDPSLYIAKPWPRFFARIFDIWLGSLPAGFLVGVAWYALDPHTADQIFNNAVAATLVVLPFVMVIDGVVVGLFGNSLGKAILGIKVLPNAEKEFTAGAAITRNFGVWFRGLALGFPLVNLFTMAAAYNKLNEGRKLQWDIDANVRVARIGSQPWRYVLFGVLFVLLFFVNMALIGADA